MKEAVDTISDLAYSLTRAQYDLHVSVSRGRFIAVLCRVGESEIAHIACGVDLEEVIEHVLKKLEN